MKVDRRRRCRHEGTEDWEGMGDTGDVDSRHSWRGDDETHAQGDGDCRRSSLC